VLPHSRQQARCRVLRRLYDRPELFRKVTRAQGGLRAAPGPGVSRLVVIAPSLSIDNLVVGFALDAYRVNLSVAVVTIAISVALSLLGLELGRHLRKRIARRSVLFGGAGRVLVGIAIGTGLASRDSS
jgi:putative Mn2+ efflux pump MntP